MAIVAAAALAAFWPASALAATQPSLGSAASYAVLAGSTITNTGNTVITGNLGLSPGSSVTGFPPGTASARHVDDAAVIQAKSDLVTGYGNAASATSNDNLSGTDLGGLILTPGVYTFSSSAQLTGTLTLSGNGVFIFQIGSTLTTATDSVVVLKDGAQACAVYWQIGSSATLGTGTQFRGNLMALASITVVTSADVVGRALARNGAVTLDTNDITAPTGTCTVGATTYTPPASSTATPSGSPSASGSVSTTTNLGGGSTSAPPPETGAGGGVAASAAGTAATPSSLFPGLLLVLGGGGIVAIVGRRSRVAAR
jgi:hypothetical protein